MVRQERDVDVLPASLYGQLWCLKREAPGILAVGTNEPALSIYEVRDEARRPLYSGVTSVQPSRSISLADAPVSCAPLYGADDVSALCCALAYANGTVGVSRIGAGRGSREAGSLLQGPELLSAATGCCVVETGAGDASMSVVVTGGASGLAAFTMHDCGPELRSAELVICEDARTVWVDTRSLRVADSDSARYVTIRAAVTAVASWKDRLAWLLTDGRLLVARLAREDRASSSGGKDCSDARIVAHVEHVSDTDAGRGTWMAFSECGGFLSAAFWGGRAVLLRVQDHDGTAIRHWMPLLRVDIVAQSVCDSGAPRAEDMLAHGAALGVWIGAGDLVLWVCGAYAVACNASTGALVPASLAAIPAERPLRGLAVVSARCGALEVALLSADGRVLRCAWDELLRSGDPTWWPLPRASLVSRVALTPFQFALIDDIDTTGDARCLTRGAPGPPASKLFPSTSRRSRVVALPRVPLDELSNATAVASQQLLVVALPRALYWTQLCSASLWHGTVVAEKEIADIALANAEGNVVAVSFTDWSFSVCALSSSDSCAQGRNTSRKIVDFRISREAHADVGSASIPEDVYERLQYARPKLVEVVSLGRTGDCSVIVRPEWNRDMPSAPSGQRPLVGIAVTITGGKVVQHRVLEAEFAELVAVVGNGCLVGRTRAACKDERERHWVVALEGLRLQRSTLLSTAMCAYDASPSLEHEIADLLELRARLAEGTRAAHSRG